MTGLSGLALLPTHRLGAVLAVGAGVLAALSLTVTGHAGTAPPRWLSLPLVLLHGLAATFWVGALWPLTVILRQEPASEAARLVRRFSAMAVAAVLVLLAAGAGLSALQLVAVAAIAETGYGRVWLAKMAAVAGLLGVAVWNRWVATPRLERGHASASSGLWRGVRVEIALVVVILMLTASFALTPPPRALPAFAASPPSEPVGYTAVATGNGLTAVLEVAPARVGRNHVQLHLADTDGNPVVLETLAEWSMPGLEAVRLPLTADDGGRAVADIDLPREGRWTVRLRLSRPEGATALTVPVPVAPP